MNQHTWYKQFAWLLPFIAFGCGYYLPTLFFAREVITVPSVIGTSLREAATILSNKGLNIRIVRQEERSDVPDGFVLEQVPRDGKEIRPSQHVFVSVSCEPASLFLPDFVGLALEEAKAWGRAQGIAVRQCSVPSTHPSGTVIAQMPAAKKAIGRGQALTVYVSTLRNTLFIMPRLIGLGAQEAQKIIIDQGQHVDVVHAEKINPHHQCVHCVVRDQKPLAGSIVDCGKKLYVQLSVS